MKRGVTKLKKLNSIRGLQLSAVMVLGLMLLVPMIAQADSINPGVLDVDSKHYGKTYGEWSAAWWQWAFSIPTSKNPLVDSDGSNAANGQQGPVWFLAGKLCVTGGEPCGTITDPATANRVVDVPAGKALFFPILNAEWDNLGADEPLNETELRDIVKAQMDMGENMVAEVDGVPINGLDSVLTTQYRVTSPVFNYHIPEDNTYSLFGYNYPKQTIKGAVADGVFLMLAPLPKGTHTIHFKGNFGTFFYLDIYYTIHVVPEKS